MSNNFFTLYGGNIEVFVQDQTNFDFKSALKKLQKIIPNYYLLQGIDIIYIGKFPDLEERSLNAAYADGAIYVTPEQSSEEDFLDDVIHEIAHSLEERFTDFIYDDAELQLEFRKKYFNLINILSKQTNIKVPKSFLTNVPYDYTPEWDDFLYKVVGYDTLHILTSGLFASPYGATSLREYWANAFEHFYLTSEEEVARISPGVHKKIKELNEYSEST